MFCRFTSFLQRVIAEKVRNTINVMTDLKAIDTESYLNSLINSLRVAINDPINVVVRHPINIPKSLNPSMFLSSRSYSSSSSDSSSSVSGYLLN